MRIIKSNAESYSVSHMSNHRITDVLLLQAKLWPPTVVFGRIYFDDLVIFLGCVHFRMQKWGDRSLPLSKKNEKATD